MRHFTYRVLADARTLSSDLWSDGRGWILLSVSFGWFLSHGVRTVYPALLPFLVQEFELSLSVSGLLLTMLWGAYAIGQFPGGMLGDRIGEGRILVASTVVSGFMMLLVTFANGLSALFLGTIMFALATAMFGPTRFTIFNDIYTKRTGSAVGLTMAAGSAGDAVLPVISTIAATYVSWRLGFGVTIPVFLCAALVLWMFVPDRTSTTPNVVETLSLGGLKRIGRGVTDQSILTVLVIQMCLSFGMQGIVSFYPTYLILAKGVSPFLASSLYGMIFVLAFFVQPLTGSLMDRFGSRRSLITVVSLGSLPLWLLPLATNLVQLAVLTALLSALKGYGVITQTYLTDALPDDMKGSGLGVLRSSWILIGATSPLLVGALAEIGFMTQAFYLLAAATSLSLLIVILRL